MFWLEDGVFSFEIIPKNCKSILQDESGWIESFWIVSEVKTLPTAKLYPPEIQETRKLVTLKFIENKIC